jgi:hypothetical protein
LFCHAQQKISLTNVSSFRKYITVHAIPPEALIELWRRIEADDECDAKERLIGNVFQTFERLFDRIYR